jgi:hypothetical protein
MKTNHILLLIFFVSLFLISNHLVDITTWAINNNTGTTNGFWDNNDMTKMYHFVWYMSYLAFFGVVVMYILHNNNAYKL